MSHVLLPCNFSTWSSSQAEAVPQECWYLWSMVRQVDANPTQCSPSATELAVGWCHACLQLGETPAFLSPLLVNCMGSHFLNHLQKEPAGSFLSVPSSLPLALSCKQVISYLPLSVSGLGRTPHPSPFSIGFLFLELQCDILKTRIK